MIGQFARYLEQMGAERDWEKSSFVTCKESLGSQGPRLKDKTTHWIDLVGITATLKTVAGADWVLHFLDNLKHWQSCCFLLFRQNCLSKGKGNKWKDLASSASADRTLRCCLLLQMFIFLHLTGKPTKFCTLFAEHLNQGMDQLWWESELEDLFW